MACCSSNSSSHRLVRLIVVTPFGERSGPACDRARLRLAHPGRQRRWLRHEDFLYRAAILRRRHSFVARSAFNRCAACCRTTLPASAERGVGLPLTFAALNLYAAPHLAQTN